MGKNLQTNKWTILRTSVYQIFFFPCRVFVSNASFIPRAFQQGSRQECSSTCTSYSLTRLGGKQMGFDNKTGISMDLFSAPQSIIDSGAIVAVASLLHQKGSCSERFSFHPRTMLKEFVFEVHEKRNPLWIIYSKLTFNESLRHSTKLSSRAVCKWIEMQLIVGSQIIHLRS